MKRLASSLAIVALVMASALSVEAKPSPLFRQFTRACSQKDDARALAIIESGLGANEADEDGNTVLGWAARGGLPKAVEELVKRGADVHAITDYHYTILRLAIGGRSLEAIASLLSHGVGVNEPCDGIDYAPLMEASRFGYADVVSLLLAKGAEVNARGREGVTALEEAAETNRAAVVILLAEHGAKLDQVGSNHMTPLMWAALAGHLDAVKALVAKGAKLDLKSTDYQETPLALACRADSDKGSDHLGLVQFLLAHGASPSLPDKHGDTPLVVATSAGCAAIVKALAAGGAKANSEGEGLKAFRLALHQKNRAVLQTLLDLGANPDAKVDDTTPALLYAIEIERDPALVQALVGAKANVNATRRQGMIGMVVGGPPGGGFYEYSALIAAVRAGSVPMVSALLEAGANRDYKDSEGKTALDRAREAGNAPMVGLLLSHNT